MTLSSNSHSQHHSHLLLRFKNGSCLDKCNACAHMGNLFFFNKVDLVVENPVGSQWGVSVSSRVPGTAT